MTVANKLARADPGHLGVLREALKVADPKGRLLPIGISRIEIGPEALGLLPEVVSELTQGKRVSLVVDATPMSRDGENLKELAVRLLDESFELERCMLGSRRAQLHADEEALSEAEALVAGADCVVVVGSGTITDICKEATRRNGSPPLVVVQTAASVNAFSDDVSVLLKSGTKRTVPSRWPDALLVDLPTLASAPTDMNLAGFGDLISMWTAPADWYLASVVGMDDSYHPAPVAMLYEQGRELLDAAAALRRGEPEALDRLARVLTLSGITLGIAGKTAPLSGTEHLVSHLIDMAAEQAGNPVAFHGAQVAVATVPVAAAWEITLAELDPSTMDLDCLFPDESTMGPVVRGAFAGIDPSGRVGEECWSDYAKKLSGWRGARPELESFLAGWPAERDRLRELVPPTEECVEALVTAGLPLRFEELPTPIPEEQARWAFANAHLMRNRFSSADLFQYLDWFDEAFTDRVFTRMRELADRARQ
jgi:glycerol-1-phosphate dehydrogenase [NAD(P)+]